MCKAPKVTAQTPAATPPPPPAEAASQAQGDVIRDENLRSDAELKARRKGRNALRIRLNAGNTGDSTGLNIPRA